MGPRAEDQAPGGLTASVRHRRTASKDAPYEQGQRVVVKLEHSQQDRVHAQEVSDQRAYALDRTVLADERGCTYDPEQLFEPCVHFGVLSVVPYAGSGLVVLWLQSHAERLCCKCSCSFRSACVSLCFSVQQVA